MIAEKENCYAQDKSFASSFLFLATIELNGQKFT